MATPDPERELFNSALSDTPMETIEATAEVEVTTEAQTQTDERPRDDKGRFASKQEDANPEPTTEQPAPAAAAKVEDNPQPQAERERGEIPAWRLREEAEAKREAAARAEQYQRELEETRRQNAAFQQQMATLQRQLQERNSPPPDMYADPEGYQRHQANQYQSSMRAMQAKMDLRFAKVQYGEKAVDEADAEFTRHASMNPNDPFVLSVIHNSETPATDVVNWYQQQQNQKRLAGKSIDDLLKEEREKALNDPAFLAQAIEKAKATAKPVQTQANSTIPSLNRTTAAASVTTDDDESDAGLLKAALRR